MHPLILDKTQATPSPPALGAMASGVRYQTRFFWHHALAMLHPDPVVAKVSLEVRGVGAVDDVGVYYVPPGINDRGCTVDVDFFQLKYHVTQAGAVDHEALLDPAWTGTRAPMLRRLADAWTLVRAQHRNPRLSFVTNWVWDPRCPLAPLIRDGGRLDGNFLSKGRRSAIGKIRAQWQQAANLPDTDFAAFVAALRFSTSAVSLEEAEMRLRTACQLAGLVPIDAGRDHSPYDDLAARFIESGRTEHTPATLRAVVEQQGLVATREPPFKSTFAVRSFTRYAHVAETDGAVSVDLSDLFDGRQAVSEASWPAVRDRLGAAIQAVTALAEPIHIALDAHLSIAWYTGYLLDPKSGKRVILRQRNKGMGIELWDVSSPRRPEGAGSWTLIPSQTCGGGELAVVISVTHSALADAMRFVHGSLPAVGSIIHAELAPVGPQAIEDGGHARWLADDLIRKLSGSVAELRPTHVHVFPACPASLMFLLGQESRVLGPTTVYEFDFGHAGRAYRPGMTTAAEYNV